jgi:hypothetical protein
MLKVKVRDRKTGTERTVTPKAYAAQGPKVYEKLGMVEVDDNGQEIGELQKSPNQNPAQVSRSVKGAAPVVVVRSQIASPEKPFPVEETEATETASEQTTPAEVAAETTTAQGKVKAKPGPKPKVKSISSNPDQDEK